MNLRNRVLVGAVSAVLATSVIKLEGTRYVPYEDVVGVLTVCEGHTGRDVVKNRVYTPEECKTLRERDLKTTREGIYKCINVPVTPYQFDAFTLFAYNVGVNNFCTSGVVRELNQGNSEYACRRMATHPNGQPAWSFAGGKYIQGLQNRRLYERDMCLGKLEKQP